MSLEEAVRENTVAILALTAAMLDATVITPVTAAVAPAPAKPAAATKPAAAAKPAAAPKPAAAEGAKPTLDEAYTVAVRYVNDVAKAKGREAAIKMLQDAGCPKNSMGGYNLPRLTDNPKPSVDLLIAVATEGAKLLEPTA